jgi:urea transport system ATP-binding protein
MLALDGIGAAYGSSQVLSDVGLAIGAGEAVALLGRNGAGKTTLMRTIVGLHAANAGRIAFAGEDLTTLRPYARARRGIAYVPQGRGIFPHLSVAENLALGKAAASARHGPSVPVEDFFPTLGRLRDRAGGVLSGGEQQQLALARALVSAPRVLLLDEPTEGIQPSIVQAIEAVLQRVRAEFGIAILLVEQHLDFAWSLAERYYVMQRGRIVREGATAAESPDAVAHLLSV